MKSFSVIDLIFLLGIGQGFLLIFGISRVKNEINSSNKILIIILFIATFSLLVRVFVDYLGNFLMIRIGSLIDAGILIVGPLIYIYVKNILNHQKDRKPFWPHLIPVSLYMIYYIWSVSIPLKEFRRIVTREIWIIPYMIEALGIISMMTYWILSLQLISRHSPTSSKQKEEATLAYIKYFIGSIGIICSIWLVSFVSMFVFRTPLYNVTYNGIWIAICILFYIVGFFSLSYPAILRVRPGQNGMKLNREDMDSIEENLQLLIENQEVYSSSKLDLKGLSALLDTSPSKLSLFLNHTYNTSFYNFINGVRVNAFQKKIEKEEHLQKTLLALANEVGFHNKSTFNKAFKTHTNMTPSEFVKKSRTVNQSG